MPLGVKARKILELGLMSRIKFLFAIILFLLALPLWRYMDMMVWVWPSQIGHALSFFLWSLIFLILPLTLVLPKKHPLIFVGLIAPLSIFAYSWGPLSNMATKDSLHGHCGYLTYTGFFYPIHNIVMEAHSDDLEIRNQFCWIRKMIERLPAKFENDHELATYVNLTRDKLLSAPVKYKASLPLIALLHGKLFGFSTFKDSKMFVDSLDFWLEQYTEEIGVREYPIWNMPHGRYIKLEYGIIEKNWRDLIDGIEIF